MLSKISTFDALKHSNFRIFWLSITISQFGLEMQTVGIAWHVYEITGSAAALGLIGLMGFLPILLFSLISGIVTDRVNRQHLILIIQIVFGLLSLVLAIATLKGLDNLLLIYIVLFLNSVALAFIMPARQAVLPSLVPKEAFLNAVSLNTLTREIAVIGGPAIAGFMIEFFHVQSVYFFNFFVSVISIFGLLQVSIPKLKESTKAEFSWASIMEGIKFVKSTKILYSTMILDFLATFFSMSTVLMPIFAKDILGVGARGLGFLYAAPAAGGIIAGLAVSSIKSIKNQGKIILISVSIFGMSAVGFGLSHNFYLSLFFLSLMGAADIVSTVIRNTIRQVVTPDHLRGRMVSINMIFFAGGPQLGELEAGLLAALIGAPFSVVLGGTGTIISAALIGFFIPKLRQYQDEKQKVNHVD